MFSTPVLPRNRPTRQRAISTTVDKFPSHAECSDAILAVFARATAEDFATGSVWYGALTDQVLQDICSAARAAGRPVSRRQAAGILAALSPATGWGDNVAGALEFVVSGRMLGQTPLFNARARMIAEGYDPTVVLGGRKVRSFFANIVDPTHVGPVTVDRHALSILFLRPLSEREQKRLFSLGGYTYAAAAYRAAARHLGLSPHALQAITWTVWRREHSHHGRNADLPTGAYSFDDDSEF